MPEDLTGLRPVVPDTCSLVPLGEELEREWDDLAATCAASPFQRPGWFRAWLQAFGAERTLDLLAVRRDGALVAVLPLVNGALGAKAPVNDETPLLAPVALDTAAASSLGRRLAGAAHAVDLRFLPVGEHERALVTAARASTGTVVRELVRSSPYVAVDGSWDEHLHQAVSPSRRRNLRRAERRLRERADLRLEVHDGSRDLDRLLHEGFGLEAQGWKGREGTAVVSRPRTAAFYWALARWAAQQGVLRLQFLRLDDRPIAFSFTLEQGGSAYGVKTTYAEDLRSFGPGVLLTHWLLADAFERPGLRSFEMLGEPDPYKLEFASGVREQVRVRVYDGSVRSVVQRRAESTFSAGRAELRRRVPAETRARLAARLSTARARLAPWALQALPTGGQAGSSSRYNATSP
ncbi:GNAT family N-acetyltransferase [Kineococcus sp. TBRC 1896]|uniref:GNAT family N-acetyltransferase n=1 Tax=Kineococcus mangrovi TaxID=1660183 RepID=A0ABV4HYP4_9ACTN